MLLAIDIGNTNIVIAIHDGDNWINVWRIHTDPASTSDELFLSLRELFNSTGLELGIIDKAIVASVVPALTRSVAKAVYKVFALNAMIVSHDLDSGLVKETIPIEMGSDILCNLAQAHDMHPQGPCIVMDFGTALTLSAVDENGRVLGASIAPGLVTAVKALAGNTAQLKQVELKVPSRVLGMDSESSIRSGIMIGYSGLASALIRRASEEIGKKPYVIATGGLATTISSLISEIDLVDRDHTLNGLRLLSQLNQ
ncbi:MAG: type III pantothenate kinase [Sphaerochaetaceae bacterium]|jgi:type III pantothenate kinase|nr:type III pantothenate kinase [Sphaerochaetaceae bacterium]